MIFNLPLYYISFKKNNSLEKEIKSIGFNNINHFSAIDGRKLKPIELLKRKIITIRAYNDLINKRNEHSGIPSVGAIGCTMSHYKLWQKCISKNFPYIIIVEDDVKLKKINNKQLVKISKILKKSKSIFVSSSLYYTKNNKLEFKGTHFYIASKDACIELIKKTFPIDIQTDYFISHINNIGKINVEGFRMFKQKNIFEGYKTSIQDICIKCFLPKNIIFYIIFLILIILIIFISMRYFKKFKNCKKICKKYK